MTDSTPSPRNTVTVPITRAEAAAGEVTIPPQPFYTSKSFWSSVIAFLIGLYTQLLVMHQFDPAATGVMLMAVLNAVFRWTANQPLTVKGGVNLDGAKG